MILRNAESQAEFEKHAKMPIIPAVTPEASASRIPRRSSTPWKSFIPSRRSILMTPSALI